MCDVGEACLAGGADGEVADGGVGGGLAAGPCFLGVLAEGDVADVVLAVFDCPVLAGVNREVAGACQVRGEAGDAVGDLLRRPVAGGGPGVAVIGRDRSSRVDQVMRSGRDPVPVPGQP